MYKLNTDFEAVVLLEKFVLEMSQLRTSELRMDAQNTIIEVPESESEIDIPE
jgi:hypothetical protein